MAAAGVAAGLSFSADIIGSAASCAASVQHAAARSKAFPRKHSFPPLAADAKVFM
jgi:hypothetical protein